MKFLILALFLIFLLILTSLEAGKQSKASEILGKCQTHRVVTIEGVKIHCGTIHSSVNIEAAKYRQVKQCTKTLKEWK
tara:strand:- start:2206 stop:2439 length:234 start_codon:yes stop_codon:yes gene_type:complete